MGNELSRLFVVLGLKNNLTPELQKVSTDLKKVGIAMAALGTIITGTLVGITVKWATAGDQIAKLADKTGMSTEALSELRYAAQLSGTSLDSLAVGIKRMQVVITEASNESSAAAEALGTLGLSYKKLAELSPEDQFTAITSALADIEDPTLKAATAVAIFGRSGTEMLPLLADGSAGLQSMRDEAHKLGIVFSAEAAKKAEAFHDSITKLKAAISGLTYNIGEALAPVLTKIIDRISSIIQRISDWMHKHPLLTEAITKFAFALGVTIAAMGTYLVVSQAWIKLAPLVGAAFHASLGPIGLVTLAISGLIAGIMFLVDRIKKSANPAIEDFKKNVQDLGDAIINDLDVALRRVSQTVKGTAKDVADSLQEQKDAIDEVISFVKGIQTEGMELIPEDQLTLIKEALIAMGRPEAANQLQNIQDQIKAVRGEYDALSETARQKRIGQIELQLTPEYRKTHPLTTEDKLGLLNELSGLLSEDWKKVLKENAPDLITGLTSQKTALDTAVTGLLDSFQPLWDGVKAGWTGTLDDLQNRVIPAMNEAVKNGFLTQATADAVMKNFENLISGALPGKEVVYQNQTGDFTPLKTSWVDKFNNFLDSIFNPAYFPPKTGGNLMIPSLNIIARQAGGIATRPTLSLIGEAGPEAVIPLSRLGSLSSSTEIHLHIGNYMGDDISRRKLMRDLKQYFGQDYRRNFFSQVQSGYGTGTSSR